MKRKLLVILLSLCCIFCLSFGLAACKDDNDDNQNNTEQNIPETEGLEFTLNDDGLSYSVSGIGSVTATKIRIPAEYSGKPVTAIGIEAFYVCSEITSIIIPDSVTLIGELAFRGCTSLTSITIPDSVTYIGGSAFDYCSSLTSITIPNSVTSIGYAAFSNCTSLESLTVSSGNKVYHGAGNCIIETVSKTLIAGCKNSIIPSDGSVTSIDRKAFLWCESLTSITIPDSILAIESRAFYGCIGLESITIPDSVIYIGDEAFYDTAYYNDESNWDNGVLYIGNHLIKATNISGSYTIKSGTLIIADAAFSNCTSLESITIPGSVTSIGAFAFAYCASLTIVVFENTEGWQVFPDTLASSDLVNPETAAKYLTDTYRGYYWKCS